MTVSRALGSAPGTRAAPTLARRARAFPGEDLIGSRDRVSPR